MLVFSHHYGVVHIQRACLGLIDNNTTRVNDFFRDCVTNSSRFHDVLKCMLVFSLEIPLGVSSFISPKIIL